MIKINEGNIHIEGGIYTSRKVKYTSSAGDDDASYKHDKLARAETKIIK